jgi:hypothetical protein
MISGAPLGLTPFGFGTPVTAPEPFTAPPALSRFINSGTGQYELDSLTGQFRGMPPLRQRVLLVATMEFGSSSALRNLGIERPTKIDNTFRARMENAVKRAYYYLTDVEKIMRIDFISINKLSSGRVSVSIEYTDVEFGAQQRPVTFVVN